MNIPSIPVRNKVCHQTMDQISDKIETPLCQTLVDQKFYDDSNLEMRILIRKQLVVPLRVALNIDVADQVKETLINSNQKGKYEL